MNMQGLISVLHDSMQPGDLARVRSMLVDCYPFYYTNSSDDIPEEFYGGLLKRLDNLCRGLHVTFDETSVANAIYGAK